MENKVVVYSKNNCTPCILIKNFLNERDVPFEERNISTNEAYVTELIEMGVNGVPVLMVNDEVITNTYDFDKLEKILHGE